MKYYGTLKVLHLTLKRKWFDMIAEGIKPEEYREIKPYWIARLLWFGYEDYETPYLVDFMIKKFDLIEFKNGYNKHSPTFTVKWTGLFIREGKEEWGAEKGKKYFVTTFEKL